MSDTGDPISWMTLRKGTTVYSSDGKEVGEVDEVIADAQKDIFSGITVSSGLFGRSRFVAADLIDEMTTRSVRLTVDEAAAEGLEPYSG